MSRQYCGAWWEVQVEGQGRQTGVCMQKPDHDRGGERHQSIVLDSDDNVVWVTPAAGVAVHQLHHAETARGGRDLDVWFPRCTCGWQGPAEEEQADARDRGDDHLEKFNGLERR